MSLSSLQPLKPMNFLVENNQVSNETWSWMKAIAPFNSEVFLQNFKELAKELSSCKTKEEEYLFIKKQTSTEIKTALYSRNLIVQKKWSRYENLFSFFDTAINPNFKVNGSEVQFPGIEKMFIGQAPLPDYFKDFFSFLKTQNITDIVAIGPEMERSELKMDSYFHFENEPIETDPREILLKSSSFANHYQNSDLSYAELGYKKSYSTCAYEKAKKKDYWRLDLDSTTSQQNLHIHRFLSWLDYVPTTPELLLDFVKKVYESHHDKTASLFIHCSGGIGRSGVFALVYYFYSKFIKGEKPEFNIPEALLYARAFRAGLVKTLGEYELIYQTIELMV